MARAEVYIEDSVDGGVDLRFRFIEGYQADAGAHKVANLVRAYLDQAMEARGETPLETVKVSEGVIVTDCKMPKGENG